MIDYSPSIEKSLKKCPIAIPRQSELVNCPPNGETKNLVCIRKELNRILLEKCKHELEDEKKIQCAIDKAEEEKLPLEPKCIKTNLVELLKDQKYDLLVTGGSSKRNLQRRVQKLIDEEADNQLGLYTQLLNKKDLAVTIPEPFLKGFFQKNYVKWLDEATCFEVAFNDLLMKANKEYDLGFDEIPTHCNFLEKKLMKDDYHGLGRDNMVKAIWRTMKTRFDQKYANSFFSVPENTQINLGEEAWDSEYDIRNPITKERLYTRTKIYQDSHADRTDNWNWEYTLDQKVFYEDIYDFEGNTGHESLVNYDNSSLEYLIGYSLLDILDRVTPNELTINVPQTHGIGSDRIFYTHDFGETDKQVYLYLIDLLRHPPTKDPNLEKALEYNKVTIEELIAKVPVIDEYGDEYGIAIRKLVDLIDDLYYERYEV